MEYLKAHLSIPQQVALLTQRGLAGDASLLATRLKNVGYYRFSAYLHPFRVRKPNGQIEDNYVSGTTLDTVWAHYLFDRKLRFLMLDAIERIEVALRSRIAYHHTANKSPFAYASPSYFPHWKGYIQNLVRVRIQKTYVYSDKARKWVKPMASLAGAPSSQWHLRMQQFLHKFQQQGILLHKKGLPLHWETHPLWK